MKKSLITFIGIVSAVVMAKSYVDVKFNSTAFMNDSEIKIVKRLDDSHVRYVASYDYSKEDKLQFPVNEENSAAINKVWKLTNYAYDFGTPETLNKNYKLELVGNGLVMLAGDRELVYRMIRFNGTSLRMVKDVEGGTEMIEAVAISVAKSSNTSMSAASYEVEEEVAQGVQGLKIERDYDLSLSKAENDNKKGQTVQSASLSITTEGTVTNFIVDGQDVVAYEIKVGGLFNGEYDGQTVSGRITNGISEGKYRVRFYTGALKGQVLHFGDENAYEEVQVEEQNYDQELAQEENKESVQVERKEILDGEIDLDVNIEGYDFNN